MPARRQSRGFSLLEMLVVLALLSVVSTMGIRLIIHAGRLNRKQAARVLAFQQGRSAVARIAREIRSAMRLPGKGQVSLTGVNGQAVCLLEPAMGGHEIEPRKTTVEADTVRFATATAFHLRTGGGLGVVTYALELDKESQVRGLRRKAVRIGVEEKLAAAEAKAKDAEKQAPVAEEDPASAKAKAEAARPGRMLAKNIVELGFRYLTEPGPKGRWVNHWPPKDNLGLPAAVRIKVGVVRPADEGDTIYHYVATVYPPAQAGPGK